MNAFQSRASARDLVGVPWRDGVLGRCARKGVGHQSHAGVCALTLGPVAVGPDASAAFLKNCVDPGGRERSNLAIRPTVAFIASGDEPQLSLGEM